MVETSSGLFDELPEQERAEPRVSRLPRLREADRCQVELRPLSLEDLVADDHRVRLVWAFCETLDLGPLYGAIKAVEGRPGHPPADPRILMALWLFATVEGVGSARALARLCEQHLAYQWLCGGVGMNHKTLSDFRVAHGKVLEGLLVDSFAALLKAGIASLDRVAQDGVRVRASAGAASFRRRSTLSECRRDAQAEVDRLRAELDADPAGLSRRDAAATPPRGNARPRIGCGGWRPRSRPPRRSTRTDGRAGARSRSGRARRRRPTRPLPGRPPTRRLSRPRPAGPKRASPASRRPTSMPR